MLENKHVGPFMGLYLGAKYGLTVWAIHGPRVRAHHWAQYWYGSTLLLHFGLKMVAPYELIISGRTMGPYLKAE